MASEQYPGQPDFRREVEPMPGAKESSGQKFVEPVFKPLKTHLDPSTTEKHRYSCSREIRGHCVAFQRSGEDISPSYEQVKHKH